MNLTLSELQQLLVRIPNGKVTTYKEVVEAVMNHD
jgi:alkylated DNA nucleotide flippase Atl1